MIFDINKIVNCFYRYWSNINLKTRLIALSTLIISLIMSSMTFWILTKIQEDSTFMDIRFCQDLAVLFSANVLDLLESNSQQDLASFVEKIYLSTSSIRYILFFRVDGSLLFTLPVYSIKVHKVLQLHQNLFQFEKKDFLFGTPLVQYSKMFQDNIIDIIIPLTKSGKSLGTLNLGINAKTNLYSSSHFISNISILVFILTWMIVMISIIFNTFKFTQSIEVLLDGIQNIASGNFFYRANVNLDTDNELANVIICFNEMAEKLESYEKINVSKLTAEKNKLETIVSIIADGIILVDNELRLVFVNQAATKSFNWFNLDIIGKSIFSCFPVHVNEAVLPILNNLVKSSYVDNCNVSTAELCVKFEYDSKKVFKFLLTPVINDNSAMLSGVALITQDITREIQLNEAKNQFISNVSHELRTPLCNIGSFLETLLDYNYSLSNKQKVEFLEIANNETKRLSTLVNDILELSHLEFNFSYNLKAVNIRSILHDVVKISYLRALNNNINIVIEFDKDIGLVLAHESSLSQVVANLLSNAIKFTSFNGIIVLRVYNIPIVNTKIRFNNLGSKVHNFIRVEVIDEGIGINKGDQKSIFDRFMRIEDNIHTLEGTGLGLSIVESILDKYNTKIIVNSQLCVGTSFSFDLAEIKQAN